MPRKRNTDPNAGINFNKANQKYYARIYHGGREHYVGTYATIEEAREERGKALDRLTETGFSGGYVRNRAKKGEAETADAWTILREPGPTTFANPEHVIRYRVLAGAIEDLENPESKRVYEGAVDWFLGKNVYPKGYSFDEICGIFRLDPVAVLEKLQDKLRKDLR